MKVLTKHIKCAIVVLDSEWYTGCLLACTGETMCLLGLSIVARAYNRTKGAYHSCYEGSLFYCLIWGRQGAYYG